MGLEPNQVRCESCGKVIEYYFINPEVCPFCFGPLDGQYQESEEKVKNASNEV